MLEKVKYFIEKWCASEAHTGHLYHYSDLYSIHSMLERNSVWFSFVRHSNDTQEFMLGIDLFIKELKANEKVNSFLKVDELVCELEEEKENPTLKPFIFCVSENKDQLSQWRGYANFGKGMSVGFDDSLFRDNGNCFLKKVIYDEDEQVSIVKNVIEDYIALMKSCDPSSVQKNKGEIIAGLIQVIFTNSLIFKKSHFKEEQEWRWVYIPSPQYSGIKSRVKLNEKIVLYCENHFHQHSVKELIYGPIAGKHRETYQSVGVIKTQLGYSFSEQTSVIPFHS